jgi:hypothetical protein
VKEGRKEGKERKEKEGRRERGKEGRQKEKRVITGGRKEETKGREQ